MCDILKINGPQRGTNKRAKPKQYEGNRPKIGVIVDIFKAQKFRVFRKKKLAKSREFGGRKWINYWAYNCLQTNRKAKYNEAEAAFFFYAIGSLCATY